MWNKVCRRADADFQNRRILQVLHTLCGNSFESFATPKNTNKTCSLESFRSNECSLKRSLLYVSCNRGSGKSSVRNSEMNCKEMSFADAGDSSEMNPKLCLFPNDVDISDSDFYSPDVALEMLRKDEESNEKEDETVANLDCSACNSWSEHFENISKVTLNLNSDNGQTLKERVSIGEYIRARTETLGSLSDEPFRQRAYFGSDVVTPFSKDNKVFSSTPVRESANNEESLPPYDFAKQASLSTSTRAIPQDKLSELPIFAKPPRRSLTKEEMLNELYSFLGIQRHEQQNSVGSVQWYDRSSNNNHLNFNRNLNESSRFSECETTLSLSTFHVNFQKENWLESSQISLERDEASSKASFMESVVEPFFVKPEELSMDINSKGGRLLLKSNSRKNLKFNIKFNQEIINVCPIDGILPAKAQIGLRILVSAYIKKKNENGQDMITIICGKAEKKILIKVCKGRSPVRAIKDRTYICF